MPLILHNVPDEELYTGEDGIQRPYAMIWPEGDRQRTAPRTRAREMNETGSFGKSTRRSRSRTGSLPPKREDATMQSADRIFSNYVASRQATPSAPNTPKQPSYLTQNNAAQQQDESSQGNNQTLNNNHLQEPVEVILRGYASPSQQYAAINHFEQLAGRICEDYSREPPIEARRYKSDLRDPALTRRQPLTKAEREKVNKVAGGEHWIKVTFESQEAASNAIFSSPQKIMGHLVYAEMYRSLPPVEDAAVLDVVGNVGMFGDGLGRSTSLRRRPSQNRRGGNRGTRPSHSSQPDNLLDGSPGSHTSTQTLDTATVSHSSATMSTATITGAPETDNTNPLSHAHPEQQASNANGKGTMSRIAGARRITLLPADAALKRQPTWAERILAMIPFLGWFSGAMIGNQVPRNEVGEFDMNRASLYWKIMYWLDYWFRLFGNELVSGDKED